jgi:myo-inositol-1(or 4)-monophosphatase
MHAPERRVAIEAALAAGELLRRELGGARRIAYKGAPTNLVTEMDARAEALILDTLGRAFPDDAYLTEETGSRSGRSGRRWIVDPLDATTNYAHGVPIYAVSIALEVARETGTPTPYAALCRELWASAQAMLEPGQDHTGMAKLSERLAGETLGGNR